jgi:iron complex outermembrane receptor protein
MVIMTHPHLLFHKRLQRVIALVCLCTLVLPAVADETNEAEATFSDLSLEELMRIPVYAPSRRSQLMSEAPSYVTVITADEVRKQGYRSLGDVLRSAPGMYMSYDHNYGYLGVRGFSRPGDYNSRVLLLINGLRANDSIFDSFGTDTDALIDIDTISRVEVVSGPGSALYGTSAFFGVINVVTKNGRETGGAEVSAEIASDNIVKGRFSYGRLLDSGVEVLVSGTAYRDDGDTWHYPEFSNTTPTAGHTDDAADRDRFESIYATLLYGGLTCQVIWLDRDKYIPTAPWGTVFNDPRTMTQDRQLIRTSATIIALVNTGTACSACLERTMRTTGPTRTITWAMQTPAITASILTRCTAIP